MSYFLCLRLLFAISIMQCFFVLLAQSPIHPTNGGYSDTSKKRFQGSNHCSCTSSLFKTTKWSEANRAIVLWTLGAFYWDQSRAREEVYSCCSISDSSHSYLDSILLEILLACHTSGTFRQPCLSPAQHRERIYRENREIEKNYHPRAKPPYLSTFYWDWMTAATHTTYYCMRHTSASSCCRILSHYPRVLPVACMAHAISFDLALPSRPTPFYVNSGEISHRHFSCAVQVGGVVNITHFPEININYPSTFSTAILLISDRDRLWPCTSISIPTDSLSCQQQREFSRPIRLCQPSLRCCKHTALGEINVNHPQHLQGQFY